MPHRRGVSLAESAIVLGVIGIIVGGLFALLSPSRTQLNVNQAVDELGVIVNNVRNYYNEWQFPSPAACPAALPGSLTPLPATTGIFPSEMVTGAVSNNVWNSGSATSTALVYVCGSAPVTFAIRYTGLTTQACLAMIPRTSAFASGMNLLQIMVLNDTAGTHTFSTVSTTTTNGAISPAAAKSFCTPTAGNTITLDWYYKLGG